MISGRLAKAVTAWAVTLAVLGACSGGGRSAGSATASPSGSSPGTSAAAAVAPLTGLRVSVPNRPALVVKIENSSLARPQTGLEKADLVVEELVEGGITRFAAMYQTDDPGVVGPVRSLRDVDAAVAGPTRGLLAASGAAGVVLRRVRQAPVQVMTPSDPRAAFSRSPARKAPHNLYATARLLWAAAGTGHRAPPSAYLPWAPDAAHAGTAASDPASRPAGLVVLDFSRAAHPRWTWDASSGRWLRSEGTTPSRTASGARITAQNLVVLSVVTRDAGYRDPIGNPVPETVLVGSGKATVLSGGRQVSGTWHKAGRDAPLTLTGGNGAPLLVAPGITWVELVPTSGATAVRIS